MYRLSGEDGLKGMKSRMFVISQILTLSNYKRVISYVLIDILNNTHKVIDNKIFTEDGHPSFSPNNKNIILTDTYPDKYRNQHLYLYDISTKIKKKIGNFYSPPKYSGEYRCDLHPRFSPDGLKVCLDSPHLGRRQIIIIPLNV